MCSLGGGVVLIRTVAFDTFFMHTGPTHPYMKLYNKLSKIMQDSKISSIKCTY
jgi:hypothetical protein